MSMPGKEPLLQVSSQSQGEATALPPSAQLQASHRESAQGFGLGRNGAVPGALRWAVLLAVPGGWAQLLLHQGCSAALQTPPGNHKSCFYPDPEGCLVPRFTVPLGGLLLLK